VHTCIYCIYTYSNDALISSILDWSVACKYLAHQPHIKCNDAGYMDTAIKILDESLQYTYWAPKVSFSVKRRVSVYSSLQLMPSVSTSCFGGSSLETVLECGSTLWGATGLLSGTGIR
jgi:hypothetical protein